VSVISKRGLKRLVAKHPETETEAYNWYQVARTAKWRSLADVRIVFPSADMVGQVLVFNLLHNRYRLIATVYFPTQELYIKALLTHKEYDREEWKKWC
jgi:mRNA interferase HigB